MPPRITVDSSALAEFCRRHAIRRLALFGSVLRDDFRPDSDIDVLVEFVPEHVPGFLALGRMEEELSGLLAGRRIDLVTPKFINRRLRQQVLDSAEVVYAAQG